MDRKTYDALQASIEKWDNNAKAEFPEEYKTSERDCPLCEIYFGNDCQNCPVANATGFNNCGGTPYIYAYNSKCRWRAHVGSMLGEIRMKEAQKEAEEEALFLRAIRPIGGPEETEVAPTLTHALNISNGGIGFRLQEEKKGVLETVLFWLWPTAYCGTAIANVIFWGGFFIEVLSKNDMRLISMTALIFSMQILLLIRIIQTKEK